VLQGDYTHLLFIDADMGLRRRLIEKMIDLGEPVVGCLLPSRKRNLPPDRRGGGAGAPPRDQALDAGSTTSASRRSKGGRAAGPRVTSSRLKSRHAASC
jgi:hypothetical protein